MSRFKPNPDELCYYIEIDESQMKVRITLISGAKMNEQDYIDALQCYIDDCKKNPESVFEDGIELHDVSH